MRKMKKITCFLLLLSMLLSMLPVASVQAADTQIYIDQKQVHPLMLPVSSSKNKVPLGSICNANKLTVTSSKPSVATVFKEKLPYSTSDYIIKAKLKKAGTTIISIKTGQTTYKVTLKVVKYSNPISYIKFGGKTISGSKFNKYTNTNLKYSTFANKKCSYSVKLKSGWTLVNVSYSKKDWNGSELLYGKCYDPDKGFYYKKQKTVKVNGGAPFLLTIDVKNKKTGIEHSMTVTLK